jgi:hypothetical protein
MKLGAIARVAMLSQLVACGDAGITVPESPADDRGRLLSSFDDIKELTWSTDGTEVYFIEGLFRIRAAPVAGGTARVLYDSNISIGYILAAANKLYVSVATIGAPQGWRILRIDPASNEVDTVLFRSGYVGSALFAVSNDERFVAFGDSLYDLVAATQRALPVDQMSNPWTFSPDGSQLIYESPGTLKRIATADLYVQAWPAAAGAELGTGLSSIGPHAWDGNDPQLLRVVPDAASKHVDVFIVDANTGARREIAAIDKESVFSYQVAMSANGERVAIVLGPQFRWVQLHSIDTETGDEAIAATVSSNLSPFVTSVVVSPDGTRAVYRLFEAGTSLGTTGIAKLYVVDLN